MLSFFLLFDYLVDCQVCMFFISWGHMYMKPLLTDLHQLATSYLSVYATFSRIMTNCATKCWQDALQAPAPCTKRQASNVQNKSLLQHMQLLAASSFQNSLMMMRQDKQTYQHIFNPL